MAFTEMRILLIAGTMFLTMLTVQAQNTDKRAYLFDTGWKFHRGGAQGAENPLFDDSGWRVVDLPHDWSIEDLPGTESPFNINAISQVNGGFTTGGTGWYRKTFSLQPELKGKFFRIRFDGAYMNSDIWLNGQYVGNHPYGYSSFWFDVTKKLRFDDKNTIAVKVKNEGENSRWYSGSGIYRHVWLEVLPPVHIAIWGTYITTPVISKDEAEVRIETVIENDSPENKEIRLVTTITDSRTIQVGRTETSAKIEGGSSNLLAGELKIFKPELWSTESPVLYRAISEIWSGNELVDRMETTFGIRSISFSVTEGFLLNGKPMKLKGGCVHHDNGPLGARAYDRAEERRIELLKASGFNAIRCSHNPPSPAFLDACDRLGMLVIDEAFDMWNDPKNPNDYHLWFDDWWKKDIENMVLRDRNHPSIIMWSIGNEIPGRQRPEVVETAAKLAGCVRKLDPTRPVTSAVNDLKPYQDAYFATLDIAGYNYASGGDHNQHGIYEQDHIRVPERIMVGTESYALEAFGAWMDVIDNSFVIGDFVWTAIDYIGEASIGWRGYWQKQDFFPWNLAYCGDIDICGWKRPQSYYRDVLWKQNQISIWVKPPQPSFPLNPGRQDWSKWHWHDAADSWNWEGNEGKTIEVTVYSSCEQAELFLNGKSLGKKPTDRSTKFMATWQVPYQHGILHATGFIGRKKVAEAELKSAGEPEIIKMTADRLQINADGQDLSYITVELTDKNGLRNPNAENPVTFTIDGPGTIIAVGNGNPVSLESYTLPKRLAWHGRCLVVIKSDVKGGKIILKASTEGLPSSSAEIESIEPR